MKRRAALFVLAGALALLVAAGAAFAATVECLVGIPCLGTDGPDKLLGTGQDDRISGLAGDDVVRGFEGRDVVRGDGTTNGPSNDGNDQVYGNIGRDFLKGDGGMTC